MGASASPLDFSYDPFAGQALSDPLPLYKVLRDHHPAYWLEKYDAWALSRFEDVWRVSQDTDQFSIVDGPTYDPERLRRPYGGPPPKPVTDPMTGFSHIDPPEHTILRKAVGRSLRPRAVADLEYSVRRLAREQLSSLSAREHFDVTTEYAGPVSAAMICQLLGLDDVAPAELLRLVNNATRRIPPGRSRAAIAAQEELELILGDTVERTLASDPVGNRTMDGLQSVEIDGRRLTVPEIVNQLLTIVLGGVETVPKVVAGGLFELWTRPRQRTEVRADLRANCRIVFEEMVRYGAPLQWVGRALKYDSIIAGQRMRAGQRILLLIPSANRDEREFDDPDEFRWNRKIERHFGFGNGQHFCIGVHLARLEGRVLLEELLDRLPDYDIDPDKVEKAPSEFQVGYTRVPLIVRSVNAFTSFAEA